MRVHHLQPQLRPRDRDSNRNTPDRRYSKMSLHQRGSTSLTGMVKKQTILPLSNRWEAGSHSSTTTAMGFPTSSLQAEGITKERKFSAIPASSIGTWETSSLRT